MKELTKYFGDFGKYTDETAMHNLRHYAYMVFLMIVLVDHVSSILHTSTITLMELNQQNKQTKQQIQSQRGIKFKLQLQLQYHSQHIQLIQHDRHKQDSHRHCTFVSGRISAK